MQYLIKGMQLIGCLVVHCLYNINSITCLIIIALSYMQ